MIAGGPPALRVPRAETRLTVYRLLQLHLAAGWRLGNFRPIYIYIYMTRRAEISLQEKSNTETVAKRVRRGGCTHMRRAMKKQFLKMSAAMKVLVNDIIVLEHILKFIEMVLNVENDFKISEFYRIQTF